MYYLVRVGLVGRHISEGVPDNEMRRDHTRLYYRLMSQRTWII